MKRFRILGILAILIITADFAISFIGGWEEHRDAFMEGYNSSFEMGKPNPYSSFSLGIRPLEETRLDSLSNSLSKEEVPYEIQKINVPIVKSAWSSIAMSFGGLLVIPLIAGIYCLIRLFISISKRDVFTDKNVMRMRVFTYSFVGLSILISLVEWLDYIKAARQITLPGYEIGRFNLPVDWVLLVIVVLFTEIFAVGVKIKEEQDLTI